MQAKGLTKETIARMGVKKDATAAFRAGDAVAVVQRIQEGGKERLQVFEGDVIAVRHNGISSTFTVRKISHGVYVERIFPFYSSTIKEINVVHRGLVCRAKLFYLRKRVGKKARLAKRVVSRVATPAATTQAHEPKDTMQSVQ
jgi:large subunit ribosomal protein L19